MSKNEAMRLISELKAIPGDPAASGERDATGSVVSDALRETAAIAASLIK
jgi:hypothetical protein